ncbi:MAG TPA: prephenate dehydratase domain-containing protein, partial [Chitinophagales bacterium]|nr:prephenate dehydratase domain-containing protein [Chitinophagales bacterium]
MDKQIPTALLGPENSFHHIAASSYFGKSLQPVFKNSFDEIFNSVISGESENAIIAVKNTYAGFVGDNLIRIAKNGLHINDEVKLQIRFFLAVNHLVEPMEIREIISHPIAIKQCAGFLKKFPNTKLTEVSSTAEAANLVANDARKNIAVLAGEQVIEQTKLIILEEATLEQKDNITRFVVISKTLQMPHKSSSIIISIKGNSHLIFNSISNTS